MAEAGLKHFMVDETCKQKKDDNEESHKIRNTSSFFKFVNNGLIILSTNL